MTARGFMREFWPFVSLARAPHRFRVLAALACLLLHAHNARAAATEDETAKARAAYDRAAAASARGDQKTAAVELALADALAPNAITLRAALEAAIEADDAALGMELCARAEARGEHGEVAAIAAQAKERFQARVGRVKLVCAACEASLDGVPLRLGEERFVLIGPHVARISASGRAEERTLDLKPGALALLDAPSAPGGTAPTREAPGLSPLWFTLGVLGTAGAGVGLIVSGLDTQQKHDDFNAARCREPGPAASCERLADEGRAAQLRTNVLVGTTTALGLASVALGIVSFRKKNPGPASGFSVEAHRGGALARLVLVWP